MKKHMNQIIKLTFSDYYQAVLHPTVGHAPCGENIEYDADFILLQSRLQPRQDVEYGSFFEAAEPVNWTDTERDCLTLLQKSKDIRLIIILIRCRLRKIGLRALPEGLEALYVVLQSWPNDLHPQLYDEGEFTPILRANAFSELEDTNALLHDLRNHSLPKASGLQLTIKDVEKAHLIPREESALSDTAIAGIMDEWRLNASDDIRPLSEAYHYVIAIKQLLTEMLAHEAPDFALLRGLLQPFSSEFLSEPFALAELTEAPPPALPLQQSAEVVAEVTTTDSEPALLTPPVAVAPCAAQSVTKQAGITGRAEALLRLREVRQWFATSEPSTPVVQLLDYAEQSIGRNFSDLLKMYPVEIVTLLNQEKE
jgi:type VI secretion system protein ImpA